MYPLTKKKYKTDWTVKKRLIGIETPSLLNVILLRRTQSSLKLKYVFVFETSYEVCTFNFFRRLINLQFFFFFYK